MRRRGTRGWAKTNAMDSRHRGAGKKREKKERKEENVRVCAQRLLERSGAGAGGSSVGVLPAWSVSPLNLSLCRLWSSSRLLSLHFTSSALPSLVLITQVTLTMLVSRAVVPASSPSSLAAPVEPLLRGSIHLDIQPAPNNHCAH